MISIIAPVFNEEESLEFFYKRLSTELNKILKDYEIIFIDDGSTDNSFNILKELSKKDKSIKMFSFRKNYGKAEALMFGFQKAAGETIVTLDADLQDRPEEITHLLLKLKEGYDLVCGWRKNRRDNLKTILASKFFNTLVKIFWGLKLHDYNCGLKIYTKDAAKSLYLYGGMHRFIPLLLFQEGFKITEIPVTHDKRVHGKSKYGFSKTWKDLPDLFTVMFLTTYSKRPLHFFGTMGTILIFIGTIILSYLWIIQLSGHSIGRRPLLFVGFFSLISGLQIFFTGFLADLVIHVNQPSVLTENNKIILKYSSEKI